MSDAYGWIRAQLARLDDEGLRRQRRVRDSAQLATLQLDGRPLLNFGSNDYLGLAAELTPAAGQVPGWGSGASPMICGRGAVQAELERRLAKFEQAESALWFSSGYAANVGTLTALAGPGDVIYSDAKNHASIIDGCRLSGARIVVYPHGDAAALNRLMTTNEPARRRLIVTDSIFSMDGDFAPLEELAELAGAQDAMLVVDEAHATGVCGARGGGLVEQLGLERAIPLRVGTLSKALGSIGGFVVGPADVIEWLAHRARSYFFSTAPPDACAVAALQALDIVRDEPQRRRELLARSASLRERLRERGWNVGRSACQIIPLIVGDAQAAMQLHARLLEQGLFVPGIRPPSVPAGESLLRISLSYKHTDNDLTRLVEAVGWSSLAR